jgi:hypothetical protein
MKNTITWIEIHILCICSTLISQMSLFWNKLIPNYHMSLIQLWLAAIVFLLAQIIFMVPYIKLGLRVMSPVQIVLVAVGWTFFMQLITNELIFKNKNTIDDYIGIGCVFLGICISKFRLLY